MQHELYHALNDVDFPKINRILRAHPRLWSVTGCGGDSIAQIAAYYNSHETMETLTLVHRNAASHTGWGNPIHPSLNAAQRGHLELFHYMVRRGKVNVEACIRSLSNYPAYCGLLYCHLGFIHLLQEHCDMQLLFDHFIDRLLGDNGENINMRKFQKRLSLIIYLGGNSHTYTQARSSLSLKQRALIMTVVIASKRRCRRRTLSSHE